MTFGGFGARTFGGGTSAPIVVVPPTIENRLRGNAWLSCGIGLTNGPVDAFPDWTEIAGHLRRCKVNRGRGDERDTFREGRCTLILDNRDRRFEPGYTGSPYAPNLRINRQVRVVAKVGDNLLGHDTATFADGLGDWTSDVEEALSYTGDVDMQWWPKGRDGIGCMRVTNTGSDPYYQTLSGTDGVPVTAGATYSAVAWFRPALGTTPANGFVRITWYDSSGSYISQASGSGPLTSDWTAVTVTGAAPVGAAYAAVRLGAGATPTDVHDVDTVALLAGSSTEFEYGSDVPVFRGLIDAIRPTWKPGLPAPTGGDATVEVQLTDLTKFLAAYRLVSPWRDRMTNPVYAHQPDHWWALNDDTSTSTVTDQGTNPVDGTYAPEAERGADPLLTCNEDTSVHVDRAKAWGGKAQVATLPASVALTGTTWTVEMMVGRVRSTIAPTSQPDVIGLWIDTSSQLGALSLSQGVVIYFAASQADRTLRVGFLVVTDTTNTGTDTYFCETTFAPTDAAMHLAFVRDGTDLHVYVDGALKASAVHSRSDGYTAQDKPRLGATDVNPLSPNTMTLDMGQVAVWDVALDGAVIAEDAAMALHPWEGDTVGERVARILSQAPYDNPISNGVRNIDPNTTMVLGAQANLIEGTSALDQLRLLEQTEAGRLYVSAGGVITFLGRHATVNSEPVVTWGDDPTAGELQYVDLVESYDDERITNRVTIQRQSGLPQTAEDSPSKSEYGTHDDRKTGLLLANDNQAMDLARWVVDHYAQPTLRYEQVALAGHRSGTHLTEVAVRALTDRATIVRRPGGAPQEGDAHVEGIDHDIDLQHRTWTTRYDLSPADPKTYWCLGDPVHGGLDGNDALAF